MQTAEVLRVLHRTAKIEASQEEAAAAYFMYAQ